MAYADNNDATIFLYTKAHGTIAQYSGIAFGDDILLFRELTEHVLWYRCRCDVPCLALLVASREAGS